MAVNRSPALQRFIDFFADKFNIDQDFKDASNHDYDCTCEKCLAWWAAMGPEDADGEDFGPFTRQQVVDYCKAHDKDFDMWWA
jgi:hypothetical protein